MRRAGLFFIVLFLVGLAVSSSVYSQSITDKPLDTVLGSLQWGLDHQKAMDLYEQDIMSSYRKQAEGSRDLSYVDKLRKSSADKVDALKKSYIELKSANSGIMSVSVVGEEFMSDNNESMLQVKEDVATKYLFFLNNQLYKIVVVYDSSYIGGLAFDTFAATTAKKYGSAFSESFDEDGFFIGSLWKDKNGNCMELKNKSTTYDTFIMSFYDCKRNASVASKHAEANKRKQAAPTVGADIDALTSGVDPTATTDANINSSVDSLIGAKTEVDLLAGLPQEDIDIIKGVTTKKEVEKQKKKKAEKAKKDQKKRDKADRKAKEGLVIY